MSRHRYSLRSLMPDYLCAAAGLGLCGGIWMLAPTVPHVIVIFGGLTALFAVFTIRTLARQRIVIELTGDSITVGRSRQPALQWDELVHVKLRYYATRRNRAGGSMTLKLATGKSRLAIDSAIDGFDTIVARAARAAMENRLALDDVTQANLAALSLATAAAEVEGAAPPVSQS